MKTPMCAVFDRKIALYDPPFSIRHQGEAIRQFEDLKKDTNTRFGKNPEDYLLFQIGTYDDVTGSIENLEKPVQLG